MMSEKGRGGSANAKREWMISCKLAKPELHQCEREKRSQGGEKEEEGEACRE